MLEGRVDICAGRLGLAPRKRAAPEQLRDDEGKKASRTLHLQQEGTKRSRGPQALNYSTDGLFVPWLQVPTASHNHSTSSRSSSLYCLLAPKAPTTPTQQQQEAVDQRHVSCGRRRFGVSFFWRPGCVFPRARGGRARVMRERQPNRLLNNGWEGPTAVQLTPWTRHRQHQTRATRSLLLLQNTPGTATPAVHPPLFCVQSHINLPRHRFADRCDRERTSCVVVAVVPACNRCCCCCCAGGGPPPPSP